MRLIVCGFGTVAQSLVKLLVSRSDDLYAKYGVMPRVVGVFDRKGGVTDPSGLDLNRLVEVKKKHGSVTYYDKSKKMGVGLDIINNVDAD
ncbi:MAG: homoserine dehydrogenase, partial [Candidatus Nitrosotenuis sp.]